MDIKEIINQRYAMPDASLDRLQQCLTDTTPIQRQISCNNQNDKKTRVNTNIYSI